MYFLQLFLFLSILSSYSLQYKIINTPALWKNDRFLFHHIVIVSKKDKDLYAIDFTPVEQTTIKTKLELLLNRNVPGEVRIRHITGIDFTDDESIIESWKQNKNMDSRRVYTAIRDKELKNVMKMVLEWPDYMNLYTHNCQHFSGFVISGLNQ
jgi:hypothetical protein